MKTKLYYLFLAVSISCWDRWKGYKMAAYDVNQHCEDCRYADAFGRSCKHGLLFPLMVLITYGDVYKGPNYDKKQSNKLMNRWLKENNVERRGHDKKRY